MDISREDARRRILLSLLLYVLAFCFSIWLGYRFVIPWDYYQLLPREDLENRLLSSLFHMHMQPPLLNLILGAAVKLERGASIPAEHLLLALHFFLGAGIVISAGAFLARFLESRALVYACLVLIVLHPVLYLTQFTYFYTFHELAILAPLAALVQSELAKPGWRTYSAIAALTVLLVLTRSLFHPIWAVIILLILALPGLRRPAPAIPNARRYMLVLFASVLAMCAWPVKNRLLFGFFGYSSWQGFNFSRGLKLGPMPPLDMTIPAEFRDVPALTKRFKGDRTDAPYANHNYYGVLLQSRALGELAMQSIKDDPSQILSKVRENYWSATRFTGRDAYRADYAIGNKVMPGRDRWMRWYERAVCLDFRADPLLGVKVYQRKLPLTWLPSVLFLALPLIVSISLWRIVRQWRLEPVRARTALFLIFCIMWVLAMVLFIDGREGNRMRFSTEPYLMMLFFRLAPGRLVFRPPFNAFPVYARLRSFLAGRFSRTRT